MSASPIGVPGCPDFAFSTASTARKRIVLTQSSSSLSFSPIFGSLLASAASIAALASCAVLLMAGTSVRSVDYTRRVARKTDMNKLFAPHSDHPLFRYFTDEERHKIERIGVVRTIRADNYLIRAREADSRLFAVEEGHLDIVAKRK